VTCLTCRGTNLGGPLARGGKIRGKIEKNPRGMENVFTIRRFWGGAKRGRRGRGSKDLREGGIDSLVGRKGEKTNRVLRGGRGEG